MRKRAKIITLMMICAMAVTGCGKENTDTVATTTEAVKEVQLSSETVVSTGEGLDVSTMFSDRDKEIGYDESTSVKIELDGTSIKCDSENVETDGTTATIKEEGTYILSGNLENGSIVVDAGKSDKIQLVFHSVEISCENSAPVYVKKADKVFITLATDTTNTLSTAKEFAENEDNIDSVIFSKADLTLNGAGALKIESAYGHGIVSKDDLVITGGNYQIDAAGQGLSGNDSVRIANGEFAITSKKDGIHAENTEDTSLGFVYVAGGNFTITAEADGISASSIVQMDDGTFTLNTGGGSQNADTRGKDDFNGKWKMAEPDSGSDTAQTEESTSAKAVKAGTDLIVNAGTFDMDSSDDAIHSNTNVFINGGNFQISTGDDGIHAAAQTVIHNGEITIRKSYEGIEGQSIDITGGTIEITASDDGMNAAGGNDQNNTDGRMGEDIFAVDEDAYIRITGGTLHIDASGDGVDSNGALYVSGGETYVAGPTNDGNGALDYAGDAQITGGIFVAIGTSGMASNFGSNSTQGSMLVDLESSQAEGSEIELKDSEGNVLITYTGEKQYNSVLISCPQIEKGKSYTLVTGDVSSEIEMTDVIYGQGNNMMPGGGMGGQRKDNQTFPNGTAPEGTPGEMPQNGEGGTPPSGTPGEMPQNGGGMTPPDGKTTETGSEL